MSVLLLAWSLLLLYVCHRLYDLSVASSFLLGVYCLYTYVTVYMFTSPPSAGSPHRPAICRLVCALDCPRGVSGLFVSHRLYDLSVCLVGRWLLSAGITILFLPHVYQCLYDLPGRLLYVALCIDSDCSRGVYGVSVSVLILVPMISDARYVYHTCPVYVSTVGSFRACGFSVRALSTTVFVVPCLNLCLCSPTPAVHLRHWLVYFGNVTLECSCGCRLYLVFPSCALACGDVSVIKCHAPRADLAVGRSWL